MDALERTGVWLREMGLAEYLAIFTTHKITLSNMARLSDADLIRMGIVSFADRQRLLAAIADLPTSAVTLQSKPERRHLTVLFCDLVGSTTIATLLDPEDLASLILSYQRCCADAVARFDGFIARYVGDGILAYFGYPEARENDAERAIRAGLLIVERIGHLDVLPRTKLQVRIGIATGPAVVGDSLLERHAIVGETPNLAARLQSAAAPNSVIISQTTHRLVSPAFNCTKLDPLVLKGLERPVQAWRIMGDRREFDRFQQRRAAGLTDYVGREKEIQDLMSRWRLALAGKCQTILVVGEPGIGKSRLIEELASRIGKGSYLRINYSGSPFFTNSPLFPVIAHIERTAQILPDDNVEHRRAKLDTWLRTTWTNTPIAAGSVLASVISLPPEPHDPPPERDPAHRKAQMFRVLFAQIKEQAADQPVLLVGEDAHWFDPTTIEFLSWLIDSHKNQAFLIALTFRPEFEPPWHIADNVTLLSLQRLPRSASATLVGRVAHDQELAHELLDKIVERSDGIPLFIEELTKVVLDDPSRDAAGIIPETLQDSLVARIDGLRAGKEVLQIGATIGREFHEDLLKAVANMELEELRSRLDLLVAGNLLDSYSSSFGTTYFYKHALIQDAAYETMLIARRRLIHRRVAIALESLFPSQSHTRPELVAYHWERAGETRTALDFWKLAGARAAERSAATESAAHLRHALNILQQIPAGHDRDVLELQLNALLGGVLRAVQGPAGLDTGAAFARAKELCRRTGDNTLLAPALAGLYGYQLVRAENTGAGESARELLDLAEARGDRLYQMIGHRAVGAVLVHTGILPEARQHLERSLSLYEPRVDGPLAFLYGTDHAQTASSFLSFSLHLMGLHDQANNREDWALNHGANVGHLYSRVQTQGFRTMMRVLTREWVVAASMAHEGLVLAGERSFALMKAALLFFSSASRAALEPSPAHATELQKTAELWWSTGALNYRPFHLLLIAEAYATIGDLPRAFELLSQARSHIVSTNERWIEPEMHRLQGEFTLMLRCPSFDDAEKCFCTAIELARKQSSKMLELRAATSLATSMLNRGKSESARQLLAPIVKDVTETAEDVRRARLVLQTLGNAD